MNYFYFTLKNGETAPFLTGEDEVTDIYTFGKIPLTDKELTRFNELMKNEKTRQIFWEIYKRACGEPTDAFRCALETPFRIYADGSSEKLNLAAEIYENNYYDMEDDDEAYDFDTDFFLKNELGHNDDFFWIDNDLVEILWL